MFNLPFRTGLHGFRVGLQDDVPGFNVAGDSPASSPVPAGAADGPTVDDSPYGTASFSALALQGLGANPAAALGRGPESLRLAKDTWPGEIVVLPDGSTIDHPVSPTGKVMAPVTDLGPRLGYEIGRSGVFDPSPPP